MKTCKRQIAKAILLLMVSLMAMTGFSGCGGNEAYDTKVNVTKPIKIATLNGPTGMGMVKLMESPEKYEISIYQSPDEIMGKIITKEVDVASIPSNLAAVLYQKTEGQIVALSPNTLGVLYLIENGKSVLSLPDLKGKTIIASGKGGAPEYIFNRLLIDAGLDPARDVTMKWLANHTDVASTLMATEGTIALLPEPFVTVVTRKDKSLHIASDLNEAWQASYDMDLPMGVLIAQKDFTKSRESDLKIFINDYKASVDFVNSDNEASAELVSKYGLIADKEVAEAAIPKCNIVISLNTEDNEVMLSNFYQILFDMEPKSIGGQIPDEAFYFQWTK